MIKIETILIIDDDELDREEIKRSLPSSYAVIEAEKAEEGLALCESKKPDCVVLDYRLPDRNGIDILPDIIAMGIPVIMVTGYGDESLALKAIKSGAAYFLYKDRINRHLMEISILKSVEKKQSEQYLAELDATKKVLLKIVDKLEATRRNRCTKSGQPKKESGLQRIKKRICSWLKMP